MKYRFILLLISASLIILLSVIITSISYSNITGNVFLSSYTYTKAICDRENFCQDFLISCQGEELISARAIEDASIKHSPNWTDPRPDKDKGLCR